MKRLTANAIGIDQGSTILFSDFEDGGKMWTGNGPREVRRQVVFSTGYRALPAVSVGVSMWDLDQKSNQRSDISAENVTRTGFDVVFRTWGDTRVARIRADWIAIGEVSDDDDWDIA